MLHKIFKKGIFHKKVEKIEDDEAILKSILFKLGIGCGDNVQNSGEELVFEILKQNFKPPYCIFDVGANKGMFLQSSLRNLPFMKGSGGGGKFIVLSHLFILLGIYHKMIFQKPITLF